jgi:hypothetical protein
MITALHYYTVNNNTGYLLCGDLGGNIFAFKFTQCNKQLFSADASWSDGITVNMKQMPMDSEAVPTAIIHIKVGSDQLVCSGLSCSYGDPPSRPKTVKMMVF